MADQNTFSLILKKQPYQIPSHFQSLTDITPDIYTKLINEHQYEVKSDVSEEVLQTFIDSWVKGEPPNIQINNLSSYYQLCKEFDRMKNISQIIANIDILSLLNYINDIEDQVKNLQTKLNEKSDTYEKIIRAIFTNSGTESRLSKNKKELYIACQKENVQKVKILTQKEVEINGLSYALNVKKKTATVTCNNSLSGDIIIPKTIIHGSDEFTVTGIYKDTFNKSKSVTSIQFPKTINWIGKFTFFESSLKSLTIPSNFSFVKSGWIWGTSNLVDIKIMPCDVKNIIYYENKYILRKSDEKSDVYDILCFARRDIEVAVIPSFIKEIGPLAFNVCHKLKTVVFEDVTQLQKIDKNSFFNCSIEIFEIPQSVTMIGECSFGLCNKIKEFKFASKSELKEIADSMFTTSSIKSIVIPSYITRIGKGAFSSCEQLEKIEFTDDSNLRLIGDCAFQYASIESIKIPRHVTKIGKEAFESCERLKEIEFSSDSELEIIDDKAFYGSKLESINFPLHITTIGNSAFRSSNLEEVKIPASVKYIGENSFSYCDELTKVVIDSNSKLTTINNAFSNTSIQEINIPPSVVKLDDDWCKETPFLMFAVVMPNNKRYASNPDGTIIIGKSNINGQLDTYVFACRGLIKIQIPIGVVYVAPYAFSKCHASTIEFHPRSRLKSIGKNAFSFTLFENIKIPSRVTRIDDFAFYNCRNLKSVEFAGNRVNYIGDSAFASGKLERIDISGQHEINVINQSAFQNTNIQSFSVPREITKICESAFENCYHLNNVSFTDDSELKIIEKSAFTESSLNSISIPKKVKTICQCAFQKCHNLTEVKFSDDSELKVIEWAAFEKSNLQQISIPSKVKSLEEGWCLDTSELLEIKVMPDNKHFTNYESFVLEKSDPNSEIFDILFFVKRSIDTAIVIPHFIRKIAPNAFNQSKCPQVIFPENSVVDSFQENSFSQSSISSIMVPSSVKSFGEFAFGHCIKLKFIYFKDDSELNFIDKYAFDDSSIECFSFPPHLSKIGLGIFSSCNNLKIVEIPDNSELKDISSDAFFYTYDTIVMISSTFKGCVNLNQ